MKFLLIGIIFLTSLFQLLQVEKKTVSLTNTEVSQWIPYRKGTNWSFVDKTGNTVLELSKSYEIVYPFQHGIAMVKDSNGYGFINEQGEQIISCDLDKPHKVEVFQQDSNKLRIVRKDTIKFEKYNKIFKWEWKGFNKTTNQLSSDYYEFPTDYYGSKGGGSNSEILDKTEQFLLVERNEKWGFMNREMEEIIPCVYEKEHCLSIKEAFLLKRENVWYKVDTTGKEIRKYEVDFDAMSLVKNEHHEYVKIQKGNLFGLLDLEGNELLSINYNDFFFYSFGYYMSVPSNVIGIKKDNKIGCANISGDIIIPPIFSKIYKDGPSKNFRFLNTENQVFKIEIINQSGVETFIGEPIPTPFNKVKRIERLLWSVETNNKKGILWNDTLILPTQYDKIESISNSRLLFAAKQQSKWGLFNKNHNTLFPIEADSIVPIALDSYGSFVSGPQRRYMVLKDTFPIAFIKKEGKWAMIDNKGKLLTAFTYDEIQTGYGYYFFRVKKENKWGVINSKGKVVIPIKEEFNFNIKDKMVDRDYHQVQFYLEDGVVCKYLKGKPVISVETHGPKVFGEVDLPDTEFACICEILPSMPTGSAGAQGPAGPRGPQTPIEQLTKQFENECLKPPFEAVKTSRNLRLGVPRGIFVKVKGKWGIYDRQEKIMLIHPKFEDIDYLKQATWNYGKLNNFKAKKRGDWFIFNECGEPLSKLESETMQETKSGNLVVEKKVLNPKGNTILENFDRVEEIQGSRGFIVEKNGKLGFYTSKGEEKIPVEYDKIEQFNNELLVTKNGKKGLKNRKGEDLLPMVYDSISSNREHWQILFLTQNGKKGLATKNGEILVPTEFNKIEIVQKIGKYSDVGEYYDNTNALIFKADESWGLAIVNSYWQERQHFLAPEYEYVGNIYKKLEIVLVRKNSKYGFTSLDGQVYFED